MNLLQQELEEYRRTPDGRVIQDALIRPEY